jgi:hypothetical protein
MFSNWKAKLAVVGGLIGGLLNWFAFFGIDAKAIRDQMTAHYLFLIGALAFSTLFTFGLYWWWRSSRVTTRNIEQKVRQWTDAFGLPSKVTPNDKFHFGIVVTLPSKLPVAIRRSKAHPSYLELRSRITTTDEQRAVFDEMTKKAQESVLRTIHLECGRSKIESHWNKTLEFVCIHKQIPITPDLTEARLIDSLNEMGFAVAVLGQTIHGLIKPPSVRGNDTD